MKLLKEFGINLDKDGLVKTALTHSSYANEHNTVSYERLEYLGDAVLEVIVSDYFYNNTDFDEGVMSRMRSCYVCEDALYEYAKKIKLKDYIRIGNAMKEPNKTIIADVFEALMAVVYLEYGISYVNKIFNQLVIPYIEKGIIFSNDYKTNLQELIQTKQEKVDYVVVKEEGPSHEKHFEVEAIVDGIVYGYGEGKSKKEAEQSAAKDALKKHV